MTTVRSRLAKASVGLLGLGAASLAWGTLVERRWYDIRHETLPILSSDYCRSADHSGSARLRLLFFSDLHLAPGQHHRREFLLGAAAAWHPDLVISGGDNLETAAALEEVISIHREIAEITAAPCIAVLGAHDRWESRPINPFQYFGGPSLGPQGRELDTDRLISGLRDSGWEVLINQHTVVETCTGPVGLIGLDDPHIDREDLSVVPGRLETAKLVAAIGVVHAPYVAPLQALAQSGCDLTLSGHTHGGQVAIPFHGAVVTNCDLPPRQAKGTSLIDGMPLHVSAGLGHSLYAPFRFACRPELSVLDLIPQQ